MTNITKAAQDALMKFDPANGGARPYPSDAYQWRQFHGPAMAWMFNPWTGTQRTTGDVGSDPQGLLICPPGGQLYAETHIPEARSISDEMMDCVDRLGSEFDSVDPRVWGHLLVYAPDDKVMARARAAPSPQAPGRRKGPPGITLEPQSHEQPAPVDELDELEADMADKAAVMPAAVVAEVYQSRYTIEWVNGPVPTGTNLYAGPKVVKAWAEEVPEDSVCDTSMTAPKLCAFKRGARAILALRPAVEPMTGGAWLATRLWNSRYEWTCPADIASMLAGHEEAHMPEATTDAARDVLAERHRQISAEGWAPEHDDEHGSGDLAKAAACYAVGAKIIAKTFAGVHVNVWPWSDEWWKPCDRRRSLVKSGALILAEIERLDRATGITAKAEDTHQPTKEAEKP